MPPPVPPPGYRFLAVVSGENGLPVGGAQVMVGGSQLSSDTAGLVTVPTTLRDGGSIDIVAAGFLDRQTIVDRASFVLWPRTTATGLTEEFTREIVYTSTGSPPVFPVPLRRWDPSVTALEVVYLSDADPADPLIPGGLQPFTSRGLQVLERAVDEVNAVLGGTLLLGHPHAAAGTPSGPFVRVRIGPSYPPCLAGFGGFSTGPGPGVQSTTITLCSQQRAETLQLIKHELGHSLGLMHSSATTDLMYPNTNPNNVSFAPREVLVIHLMYQRPYGNQFPDRDRGVSAADREHDAGSACGADLRGASRSAAGPW
jgi:hypothetical protein